MANKKGGWYRDHQRHVLAGKGVKTSSHVKLPIASGTSTQSLKYEIVKSRAGDIEYEGYENHKNAFKHFFKKELSGLSEEEYARAFEKFTEGRVDCARDLSTVNSNELWSKIDIYLGAYDAGKEAFRSDLELNGYRLMGEYSTADILRKEFNKQMSYR